MKTPPDILEKYEQAAFGLDYGEVSLTLTLKQGRPRYIVSRNESFIPDEKLSSCFNFNAEESRSIYD